MNSSNTYILSNQPIKEDCNSCIHNKVCRYKDNFMESLKSLEVKLDSFIKIRYECDYYQSNMYSNFPDIRYLNLNQGSNSDACRDCDFGKSISGKSPSEYIGDIPCDYCLNNPNLPYCKASSNQTTIKERQVINEEFGESKNV